MKQDTFIIQVSIVVTLAHVLALFTISALGLRTTDISTKQDNTIMVMQLDGISLGNQDDDGMPAKSQVEDAGKTNEFSKKAAALAKPEKTKIYQTNKQAEQILTTTAKAEFAVPKTVEKIESKTPVSTEPASNPVQKTEPNTAKSKESESKGEHSLASTNGQAGGGNGRSSEGSTGGSGTSPGSRKGNSDGSGVGGGGHSANRPVVVKVARTIKSSLKGKVSIIALVGSKNNLLSILDVSGDIPELRDKAQRLAQNGRYVSARQDGQAIEKSVKFTISFE